MPEDPEEITAQANSDSVPALLVGLGASAGGIAALQQFFSLAPTDASVAYVVVLHLSPEHESRLAELLEGVTTMPVTRVTDTTQVAPNHVYVISPNTSLRMRDGTLTVSDVLRLEERRAPVDIFFRTLADAHGARAVAIVLSGTGPNGSNGIKRVKECGGLVIAQDPSEAEYEEMPRNSIGTGVVDYVLPVHEMPARLTAYRERTGRQDGEARPLAAEVTNEALRDIMSVLRLRTGHDFSNYKPATILRRIERRQNLHELSDIREYARFLRQHPSEAIALLKELLISVTHFFREPAAFAALENFAIPRLLRSKQPKDNLRVWVAGCATGEEAYSVAMLFVEAVHELPQGPALQLFATDIDDEAVSSARDGFYSDADVADVPAERLRRFFVRELGGYRVSHDLREAVLFAHHDVLKDPPFSNIDLICCRNLLIYLNRPAQQAVLDTFQFALNDGGFLLLGSSETADVSGESFSLVHKEAHLYESRAVPLGPLPRLADPITMPRVTTPPRTSSSERPEGQLSPGELHLRLLEHSAPPSILVDEEHQVVHLSPRAGRYLQIGGGEPTRDLVKMVRPEFRVELRSALYQAARNRTRVEIPNLEIALESGERRALTITVQPSLADDQLPRGFLVVLFDESPATGEPAARRAASAPLASDAARQLEDELAYVKTQLRATIEQHEVQVEEAKASKEELQKVNEELRSAAEELETSKEELQSVNEELTTVNQELKIKIEELGLTNNDFQNLINSTEIGTIFLDRSLRIKLSTPRARDVFNLLPLDVGRPLSDITSSILYEGLASDAETVLETLRTVEREIQSRDGRWFLTRVLPYRTTDQRIEGVVLTFQDITDRRKAESEVRESEERLRLLIDSVKDYAIFTLDPEGNVATWNAGARRMFGFDHEEIIGQPVGLIFTDEDRAAGVPEAEMAAAVRDGRADDERWHMRKDRTLLYCSGVTTPLNGPGPRGFVKIARDLTVPRDAADALRRAQESVEDRVRARTMQLQAEVTARAEAEQRVTALVGQLVTAQEDERARIARDIHDHVGQQLTALRLSLERIQGSAKDRTSDDLAKVLELAREIDGEIDFLAWELRPAALDDLGLVVALSKYIHAWSEHHAIAAAFRTAGLKDRRLPADAEVSFYRIAQEALNNVAKHAHASRVDVILERSGEAVVLVVEDDGVGFELEGGDCALGLGLIGMRERAALAGASLQIETGPGRGTTIFVRKPEQQEA